MQLVLPIAVILVALSVVTDSAEIPVPERSVSQKFEKFQEEFQTFMDDVGEKARGAFRDLHNSELVNKTRNWFTENFRKMKEKFRTTFSNGETN
ncbi:apolipoprotein C-I-like [Sphaerodactylus townsendi]|uniref:apolipoprotein C-I-like n=1 Tax=Sphaerodactylus townsendi TaxID=933632 RepID=UPI002026D869|nr:apolipoprotein C-I-like [Sphaerodactylus townsendi]XP_048358197.1 apolipoprotein C-I-like [Sphaerodactylus townsendi]